MQTISNQGVRIGEAKVRCCMARAAPRLVYAVSSAAGHDKAGHPETAGRLDHVIKALQQHRLSTHPLVQQVAAKQCASEQLLSTLQLVHPAGYLQRLQQVCGTLQETTMVDDSTYIAPGSFVACCETASAVLAVLDAVIAGSAASPRDTPGPAGFCLVRPPGHHVLAARPMGFGLMNFIAMAARHAQVQSVVPIQKVMIVDFDVHHGNGTEDIFYKDPSVLYVSTHQQGLWPYTASINCVSSPDEPVQMALDQVIWPAACSFKPDLVLVSAGYDAHWRDPLAGLQFRSSTYHMLCNSIVGMSQELCQGRCMFILEGGYDLPSLGEAVCSSFAGILKEGTLSDTDAMRLLDEPLEKVQSVLQQVLASRGHH